MPPTHTLSDAALARAVSANRRWAKSLGWRPHTGAIAALTGAGRGDRAFARAVAAWQVDKALDVDGIVGPDTWAAMQPALALPPSVPDGFAAVLRTFGDPRPLLESDGSISQAHEKIWMRQTLARGKLPFAIPIPGGGTKERFMAHRLLVPVFEAVFAEIARLGLKGEVHSWGGIYNFRAVRGRTRLSLHAFGAAIDLNPETNRLGRAGDMSPRIVEVFERFSFTWGGDFRRPDPMHFQYARGC